MWTAGPWVHDIDPIIGTVLGVHLWWYGLSYSLGFLNAHLFFMRRRLELGLSRREVYDLSLLLAVGVLVGGRLIVVNNEWAFYRNHAGLIPAVWIGGMATHGLIIGGFTGVTIFCLLRRKPLLVMLDAMAIPAALILCVGRIGNFIDGQIVGSVTSVPWAVKFPDAEGFRHPVVLYDGLKNLLIVPVLMFARRRGVPPGGLAARFLFLYAFIRIFIDYFREYPLTLLGLPSGQTMNILMSVAGVALLWRNRRRPLAPKGTTAPRTDETGGSAGLWWRRALFAALVIGSLVIASDATRDIPAKYGKRHPGLEHSRMYPPIPHPAGEKW
jgi:phosphatidylglycerol---prolipoprotein diacylglyceryl transferase